MGLQDRIQTAAREAVEHPQQQAGYRGGQHGNQAGSAGRSQERKCHKGHDQDTDNGLHHPQEQGNAPPLVLAQKVDQHREGEHGDSAHTEGEQEAQGVDAQQDGSAQAAPGRLGGADQIEGEKHAEGKETGHDVGVAKDTGDTDAGLISGGHILERAAEEAVHQAEESAGQELGGGSVDAQKSKGGGDRGDHGGQIGQFPFSEVQDDHQENAEGREDLCDLGGGQAAKTGIQTGRTVEQQVGADSQEGDPHPMP